MRYSVIVRYFGGEVTGFTVKADSVSEAWEKLAGTLAFDHVQAVELAEIVATDHEIE